MADQLHAIAVGIKLLSLYYGKLSAVSIYRPQKVQGGEYYCIKTQMANQGYITVFLAYMNVLD
jgi:hypothetical protein